MTPIPAPHEETIRTPARNKVRLDPGLQKIILAWPHLWRSMAALCSSSRP
jgi:hypothetical protein